MRKNLRLIQSVQISIILVCTLLCTACVPWYHSRYQLPHYDPNLGINPQRLDAGMALANHYIHEKNYTGIHTTPANVPGHCVWHGGIRHCIGSSNLSASAPFKDVIYGPENL